MAIAITATSTFKPIIMRAGPITFVLARLTPSGSYATGGDLVGGSATGLMDLYRFGGAVRIRFALIFGEAGYMYQYDVSTGKVMVRVATTTGANIGLAEHSAAAYAAGVTGDEIYVWVCFSSTQG